MRPSASSASWASLLAGNTWQTQGCPRAAAHESFGGSFGSRDVCRWEVGSTAVRSTTPYSLTTAVDPFSLLASRATNKASSGMESRARFAGWARGWAEPTTARSKVRSTEYGAPDGVRRQQVAPWLAYTVEGWRCRARLERVLEANPCESSVSCFLHGLCGRNSRPRR